jgi:hypothetical protein
MQYNITDTPDRLRDALQSGFNVPGGADVFIVIS